MRYDTPSGGCTATITEHASDETAMTLPGERGYQLAGAGSCSEKAMNAAGMGEGITLSGLAFRTPALWRD